MSETIHIKGKKYILLPFSFLDTVGSAIYKFFGEHHKIVEQMYAENKLYRSRGLHYVKTKNGREPAFALTIAEINFLRESYSKSQEIF